MTSGGTSMIKKISLPPIVDDENDYPFDIKIVCEHENLFTINSGAIYVNMEVFYSLNLQYNSSESYETPVTVEITDSAYPLSKLYKSTFYIMFAPKGDLFKIQSQPVENVPE